jgi:serine protein kinase
MNVPRLSSLKLSPLFGEGGFLQREPLSESRGLQREAGSPHNSNVSGADLIASVDARLDRRRFQDHHWSGTFWEYLDICAKQPAVVRNAYQRLYDAIMSQGNERYKVFKKEAIRYNFFSDPFDNGADAIFGLDFALMQLVDFLRSAAEGYGTDKRILLLHGPVGSSKSTIARLLKKGIEHYSKTPEGAMYSFSWRLDEQCEVSASEHDAKLAASTHEFKCPMHEEPLALPQRQTKSVWRSGSVLPKDF